MRKVEVYWCDDVPTKDDIAEAFTKALLGTPVLIYWQVTYSGMYSRLITKEAVKKMTSEQYWENCIPHMYGV